MRIIPLSIVDQSGAQRIDIQDVKVENAWLDVVCDGKVLHKKIAVRAKDGQASVFLPQNKTALECTWELRDCANGKGNVLDKTVATWTLPRHITFFIMLSSHTDIGLHNAQYFQRYTSEQFIDEIVELIEKTKKRPVNDRYRYTIEGTWFWENYPKDRGAEAARKIVKKYISKGDIGVCCGVAGNCTQLYGLEELCRSAYERKKLEEKYGIHSKTMSMIDFNGISPSIIQPYADAGYENIIFAPNQWNPLRSTFVKMDETQPCAVCNPEARGGGSRIDVRYDSPLPMLFYWQTKDDSRRLLVWASTQYNYGAWRIGLRSHPQPTDNTLEIMETKMGAFLPMFEKRYPYSTWLMPCYGDDQQPSLCVTDAIRDWNAKYQWPQVRTLGNPDEPFERVRAEAGDAIPVLKGDITAGWCQLATSVNDYMKLRNCAEANLCKASKLAAMATLLDSRYKYPAEQLQRCWNMLVWNDEHSYGASGYKGRKVYETWMQHRAWLDSIEQISAAVTTKAVGAMEKQIAVKDDDACICFNTLDDTNVDSIQAQDKSGKKALYNCNVPAMGYAVISSKNKKKLQSCTWQKSYSIENEYFKVTASDDGTVSSILDKQKNRELVMQKAGYGFGELVYTQDNHKNYCPKLAVESIEATTCNGKAILRIKYKYSESIKGTVEMNVVLSEKQRKIDISCAITPFADLLREDRYYRFAYVAFPFNIKNAKKLVFLNGAIVEYGKDITGHGTDCYMSPHKFVCLQNKEGGIAFAQHDARTIEFDHIHPDKTEYGNPGEKPIIFSYFANDWVQAQTLYKYENTSFFLRYTVIPYEGDFKENDICTKINVPEEYRFCKKTTPHTAKYEQQNASIIKVDGHRYIVGMKVADDGDGMIVRLYGDVAAPAVFSSDLPLSFSAEQVTTDERKLDTPLPATTWGFATYRVRCKEIKPKIEKKKSRAASDLPAMVGSNYTGLVDKLASAPGDEEGSIFLLWGQNSEPDLSHYELYMSSGRSSYKLIDANVEPGPYVVVQYQVKNLVPGQKYNFYVKAVNKEGKKSARRSAIVTEQARVLPYN